MWAWTNIFGCVQFTVLLFWAAVICTVCNLYSSCFKIHEAEHISVAFVKRLFKGRSLPPIPAPTYYIITHVTQESIFGCPAIHNMIVPSWQKS
ncbi:MAG: hypothetical protein LBJ00_09570 [Planctomycetaceae bacterium]|nr:hypothetical protein [Planctomycetaceae bacterium]